MCQIKSRTYTIIYKDWNTCETFSFASPGLPLFHLFLLKKWAPRRLEKRTDAIAPTAIGQVHLWGHLLEAISSSLTKKQRQMETPTAISMWDTKNTAMELQSHHVWARMGESFHSPFSFGQNQFFSHCCKQSLYSIYLAFHFFLIFGGLRKMTRWLALLFYFSFWYDTSHGWSFWQFCPPKLTVRQEFNINVDNVPKTLFSYNSS